MSFQERMIYMKALITGASSGIGRDIATELAQRGYDLILVARNIEKLNQVKENIFLKHKKRFFLEEFRQIYWLLMMTSNFLH